MNNKVVKISNEHVSEILETAQVTSTEDLGYALVHSVIHENQPKTIVASSVGTSFKILHPKI